MDLILITGLGGRVGFELAKVFKEDGFEVEPLLHNSIYSEYLLPPVSEFSNYGNVYIVHSGQPNAPRGRLHRKRYLSATKNLIEDSGCRKIKFVFISSLSAHNGNRSNYSKDKMYLEKLTVYNSGSVIKLGVVSEIADSFTFRLLKIQKLLSYIRLDFLITSAPMYYTPAHSLNRVSKFLKSGGSWGCVESIFEGGYRAETKRNFFEEVIKNAVVFILIFLSKSGSGRADAFLSLIDGMKAPA